MADPFAHGIEPPEPKEPNMTVPFANPLARRAGAAVTAVLPAAALVLGLVVAAPGHAHADEHEAMATDMTAGLDDDRTMLVMKTPTCGCCAAWVDLARREGFAVEVTDTADYVGMKALANVPEDVWSCHTTRIGGYTVEGHVPFAAVRKLLDERPDIAGIAVPGMPAGSPGMGDDPQARYDVLAFGGAAGEGEVFFRAGVDGAEAREPGFLGRLFGRER